MCYKFALGIPRQRVAEVMALRMPEVPARYNIAPTQLVEAVYADHYITRRVASLFRWGLVPTWAKDPKIGNRLTQAQVETIFDKPAFRSAIRYRRCLIPAQGFYVWQRQPSGEKSPYFITPTDAGVMAMAGIFEHYTSSDGQSIDSLAIVTREATGVVRLLHDRMPVILPTEHHATWLDPLLSTRRDIKELLTPVPPKMIAVPVGTLVNSPLDEGPELIAPVGPALQEN
jgi:putative SOS response-associated peptidase YedK